MQTRAGECSFAEVHIAQVKPAMTWRISSIFQEWSFSGFWAAVGCAILFANTHNFGLGIGPDGVKYLAAAKHLAAGDGFRDELGVAITEAPPLYPFLISIGIRLGLAPLLAVHAVHWLALVIFLLLVANWAKTSIRSPAVRTALMLGVVLSPALTTVASRILSELPYAALSFAFLQACAAYWRTGGLNALATMALFSALAALTRYVGLAEVVTGSVVIALSHWRPSPAQRLGRAALYGFVALAPLGAWWLRNLAVDGTPMGPRALTSETLGGALTALRWTVTTWIAGRADPVLIVPAAIALAFLLGLRRTFDTWRSEPLCAVSAIYVTVYLSAILTAAVATNIDALDQRLLSPIYTPALCMAMVAVDRAYRARPSRRSAWQEWAVAGFLFVWVALLAHQSLAYARGAMVTGLPGYSSRAWRESALPRLVNSLPASSKVYSNVPWAFSYLTRHAVLPAPTHGNYRSPQASTRKVAMLPDREGQDVYLVWCTRNAPDYFVPIDGLSERYVLRRIAAQPDGEIFLVRSIRNP